MTATILLARHATHAEVGRVLSGRSDIALSDTGREEATRLANRLASVPLKAIHSSPRRRATETAEIVAQRHDLPVQIFDALDELDFGEWTGKAFDALAGDAAWDRWNTARATSGTPGGETMIGAVTRAAAHLATIEQGEAPVLCVSHCDIIRGIAAQTLGLSLDRLLAFDCDPASLTTLRLSDGDGRVVSLNEVPQ